MDTAQTACWFGVPRSVSYPDHGIDWYMAMAAAKDDALTRTRGGPRRRQQDG